MTPEAQQALAKLWNKLVEHFVTNEHIDIDSLDFFEMAVDVGLLRWETYDPDKHPFIDDDGEERAPGEDLVWVYTEVGASLSTAWLAKLTGA